MNISTGNSLELDRSISINVYSIPDEDEYVNCFELHLHNEIFDLEALYSLIEGLTFARHKLIKLVEAIDEDTNELD